jgi:aminoglycoside phosphotransferase
MGQIAGIEVGRPASIDEVTPDWMTAVLRTSGALGEGGRVSAVEPASFAEGVGFLSYLFRVGLTYEGEADGAPGSVIVKFPVDTAMRGVADGLAFYQRELRYYTDLAHEAPFRVPQAHAVVMDTASTDFVLVMEELSGLRGLDQAAGVSAEDAVTAVRGAARLHATYWDRDLTDLATTFLPLDNPIHQAVLPQIFASGWDRCKAEAGDLLSAALVTYGDRYLEVLPWLLAQQSTNATLLHGDWRADNLLIADDGSLAVIDFQIMGIGAAAYDVGYFLSQSMEPEVRQAAGPRVIDAYFAELETADIDVDRADEERILALTTAFCLIYPVSTFGSWDMLPDNAREMARAMLRRAATAIEDGDALALLPS